MNILLNGGERMRNFTFVKVFIESAPDNENWGRINELNMFVRGLKIIFKSIASVWKKIILH